MSRLQPFRKEDSIFWRLSPLMVETPAPLINIEVYRDLGQISAEWRAFEIRAAGTFYQTYAWCAAWQETDGNTTSIPHIVAGRDRNQAIRFLLPLCIRSRFGVRVLEWIAMPQTTYGYGLYDRDFLPVAKAWFSARGWAVASAAGSVDVICLGEMPATLHGFPHPLSDWFTCEGANHAYQIYLQPDYDKLYARKRSGSSRRRIRKRDAKLDSLGRCTFGLPANRAQMHNRIEEMFRQQRHRLALRGIRGVFDARDRAFVHRLADHGTDANPTLLAYHLSYGRRMVSMKLGGLYGNIYWGLISSLDNDFAPHLSPGDVSLRRLIAACCERRLSILDLATGDTAYKRQWADAIIPLHVCVRGRTLRGFVWAATILCRVVLKRSIKRSPRLFAVVLWLRKSINQYQPLAD